MREQEIGYTSLLIMTVWNAFLGILMINGLVDVLHGMLLAALGMLILVLIAWRMLMGDERPWESPRQYHKRTDK